MIYILYVYILYVHVYVCYKYICIYIYEIAHDLHTLELDEPRFFSEYRDTLTSFHFLFDYRDMNDVTKTRKNLGYFIKQIENSFCVFLL